MIIIKVAIMGAGLAGLSCAITLEKHGIEPYIFEKRNKAGDRFVNAECLFNILNRPINNCLEFIADKYDISLKPINKIRKITVRSKDNVGSAEGSLGAINIRGRHKQSFETQLENQVKTNIMYNSNKSVDYLAENFTHVVLATGDAAYSAKLNNFKQSFTLTIRGATVEGKFMPDCCNTWFNSEFAPKGYAYQVPYSNTESNIALAYPDYADNQKRDINKMWDAFFKQACHDFNQTLKITDKYEITRYIVGICNRPKINNIYFTGNCFGSLSPAVGFGQFIAILTGIYAAYDICGLNNYDKLVKPLFKNFDRSLIIRKTLEQFNDKDFNTVAKNLDNPIFENIVDKLTGDKSGIDILKWLSILLKPIVKI